MKSKVQVAQIFGPIEPLWINLEIVYSLHEIKIQFHTSGGNIYAHICVWNWTFLRLVAQWDLSLHPIIRILTEQYMAKFLIQQLLLVHFRWAHCNVGLLKDLWRNGRSSPNWQFPQWLDKSPIILDQLNYLYKSFKNWLFPTPSLNWKTTVLINVTGLVFENSTYI